MSTTLTARLLATAQLLLLALTAAETSDSTNDVSAKNALFSPCACDLTQGGCDAHCCCDKDCPAETINAWELGGDCSN